jgi:pSer/pThr/pTyr-binding forkhead associated (FHA) protein
MATGVKLVVTCGPLKGREFVFANRTFCTVGRDPGCLLRLKTDPPDPTVSRRHCLLDIDPPYVSVFDLGSRNGTFVNGARLGGRDRATGLVPPGIPLEAEVKDGDVVRVGETGFRVVIEQVFLAEEDGDGLPWAEAVEPDLAAVGT